MRIRKRKILLITTGSLVLLMAIFSISRLGTEYPYKGVSGGPAEIKKVAIFGATGTVGSGILKTLIDHEPAETIQVITRRSSDLIEQGEAMGKVVTTLHMDYLDYQAIDSVLGQVDQIYWALGTSALNVDDEQYSVIHVDFPVALAKRWLVVRGNQEPLTLHFVSGSGASESGWQHWAREKARAEQELFKLAEETGLKVISYRPGAVLGPADTGFKKGLINGVLVPLKMGIASTSIGEAMIELSNKGYEIPHRTILENREILKYSSAYQRVMINGQ